MLSGWMAAPPLRKRKYSVANEATLTRDEIVSMVDYASRYFMETLHPLQQRMDDEEWWPDAEFRALGEMGFLGITVPQEYGGQGLSYLAAGMLGEAMATSPQSRSVPKLVNQTPGFITEGAVSQSPASIIRIEASLRAARRPTKAQAAEPAPTTT